MLDLNEIHMTGRLVKDIELKSTANGSRYAWFQLAVSSSKDKEGKQNTDFVVCQLWGKPAELLEVYGQKGTRLLIHRGTLKTYVKEDPNTGLRQTNMYVLINSYGFVDGMKQSAKENSCFDTMGEAINVPF